MIGGDMDEQSGLEYLRWYESWRKQKDEAAILEVQPSTTLAPEQRTKNGYEDALEETR
jgi:hypothetical protein